MGGSGLYTICGINFKRLDKHMKCVHDQTDEEVNCEFCSKSFTNNKSKYNHVMKVHKNRFACTMCPKEYKSRDSLQKHVENVHNNSNECPFSCEYCGKSFKYKSQLNSHIQTYCQVKFMKTYKCNYCDKSFQKKSSLTTHKTVHQKVNELPKQEVINKCHVCFKTLSSAKNLKRHLGTHSFKVFIGPNQFIMERLQFNCNLCPSKYTRKYDLDRQRYNSYNI